jgi:hypothetical protein
MQRLSPPVGENQKVSRGEVEIIFSDFDAESTRHEREGTEKTPRLQAVQPNELPPAFSEKQISKRQLSI